MTVLNNNVPKREASDEFNKLIVKTQTLQTEVRKAMLPSIIDITKERPGEHSMVYANHIAKQHLKQRELQEKVASLQIEVTNFFVKRKQGGKVETDLAIFPTPEMSKALKETEPVIIGEISLPRTDNETPNVVNVYLNSIAQVKLLQDQLFKLSIGG